jgi:hypothetical protein
VTRGEIWSLLAGAGGGPAEVRHILTVEDRFVLSGRGLVLVPEVPAEVAGPSSNSWTARVRLKRPDGSELEIQARFRLEAFRPGGLRWMCYLLDIGKSVVPIGTEVWLLDEPLCPTTAS